MFDKEHTYKGATIRVGQDLDAENPRNWGALGTILSIDGANEVEGSIVSNVRQLINWNYSEEEALRKYFPDMVWFHRLYRYSHGGDVWALHDNFPDRRWDVSHAGYIIVTRQDIREYFNRQRMSDKLRQTIYDRVSQELDNFTDWSNGDVYGFMVEDSGIIDLDDVWYGWYNGVDDALANAKAMIDQMLESTEAVERHKKEEARLYG